MEGLARMRAATKVRKINNIAKDDAPVNSGCWFVETSSSAYFLLKEKLF